MALEAAPPSGRVSTEHVLNVLGRLNALPAPENAVTSLQIVMPPLANTARYDRLRAVDEAEEVIHGRSNIGKTLVIAKFLRDHPPHFDGVRGLEQRQIIAMQMPATPDQRRFYGALLFELGAPQSASATLAQLERVSRDLLRRIAPRMLIVDEVHHLLAGSHVEQRASLNLLKYLANDLKISVVAVGTSDAPLAFRTDPQMSSRFTPFEMRPPSRRSSTAASAWQLARSAGCGIRHGGGRVRLVCRPDIGSRPQRSKLAGVVGAIAGRLRTTVDVVPCQPQ